MGWTVWLALILACEDKEGGNGGGTDKSGDGSTFTDYEGDSDIDTDADSDADVDTDPTGSCPNTISEVFPADGDLEAFYRTTVEFTLLVPEAGASIEVVGPAGAVPGSTAVDGNRVIWSGDNPFSVSSAYASTLSWSCPDASTAFTTSATGVSVDEAGLAGQVYAVDLSEGRFVEPPGVGGLISGLVSNGWLLEVTSASAGELTFRAAPADPADAAVQDTCVESTEFPNAADFSENPYFSGSADSLGAYMPGMGLTMTLGNVSFSGAFSPDASTIDGGTLSYSIDTRPWALIAYGGPDSAVCDLVAGFGIACVACVDGSGSFCLDVAVVDLHGELVGGSLVAVTAADIAADPGCP